MAYLNCPFCPAQAFASVLQERVMQLGFGLMKYECISKHFFYIEQEEDIDGGSDGSVLQQQ